MKAISTRIAGVALALVAWEVIALSGWVPTEYFPALPAVASAGWGLFAAPDFLTEVGTTCLRMFAGLAIAIGLGVLAAIGVARYNIVHRMLEPLVGMLRVLPPPAIVPISIFAFGIGSKLFLFIIAFAAVWPIYMNAASALLSNEPVQVLTARSLG